jgi:outer membrane lipoprotein-sorting protein
MFKKLVLSSMLCLSTAAFAGSADLGPFEKYLNDMGTLKGDFRQDSTNGRSHTGKLHLSRPGKMRLNYNPPSPLLIVADGKWLITYDKELDETNYVSLNNTPAEFILRPNVKFSGDIQVISVVPQANDTTAITLVKSEKPDEGQITLVFANNPVSLKEWTVTDSQGSETHVILSNLSLNVPVSDSLFQFDDPNLVEQVF